MLIYYIVSGADDKRKETWLSVPILIRGICRKWRQIPVFLGEVV
jgi:hypothetical protein